MKGNITAPSGIKTHPDYEMFCQFGSPLNFLSRDNVSRGFFRKKDLSPHFSQSQAAFANHSMSSLIDLVTKFKPEKIFGDSEVVLDEVRGVKLEWIFRMEELYQAVTQARSDITDNTQSSHDELLARQRLKSQILNDEEIDAKDQESANSIKNIGYAKPSRQSPTRTYLINSRYSKYGRHSDPKLFGSLKLSYFSNLLGASDSGDESITIGSIGVENAPEIERDCVVHRMGCYKNIWQDGSEKRQNSLLDKINAVDCVTTLAAHKALTTEDQDESLKCAFIFGALRGYNIRSTIGACWAQEMSMRWVFAQKGWPQFRKMPGLYLDIEASLVGTEDPQKKFEELIDREVSEYKISVGLSQARTTSFYDFFKGIVGATKTPDPLFDNPAQQKENDFLHYLIDTKKYRAEDLHEIIFCPAEGKEKQNIFKIAAAGDKNFFELLIEKLQLDPSFKGEVGKMNLDWQSLRDTADGYGDAEVSGKIFELQAEVMSDILPLGMKERVKDFSRRTKDLARGSAKIAPQVDEEKYEKEVTPPNSEDPTNIVGVNGVTNLQENSLERKGR